MRTLKTLKTTMIFIMPLLVLILVPIPIFSSQNQSLNYSTDASLSILIRLQSSSGEDQFPHEVYLPDSDEQNSHAFYGRENVQSGLSVQGV